tara:strand:- start:3074 stop:3802 length:729 start_codon:yes stop_codon:yes gene_type:complete
MLVQQHGIAHWPQHQRRLQEALYRLGIKVSCFMWAEIEQVLKQLVCQNIDLGCKLIITRGQGRGYACRGDHQPTWVVQEFPLPCYDNWQENGISLDIHPMPLAHVPLLAGMKHLNRLEQVLLMQTWHNAADFDEVILCDDEGYMIETSSSNIALIQNHKLILPTHGTAGVCGIMRYLLMQAWLDWGRNVTVRRVHQTELQHTDHLLVMNTLMGLVPVVQVKANTYKKLPEYLDLQGYIETSL